VSNRELKVLSASQSLLLAVSTALRRPLTSLLDTGAAALPHVLRM
jgi:hypothetical protein